MKAVLKEEKWIPRVRIPADVDPIALADRLKGDLTAEWLKRRAKLKRYKLKSLPVR